jgi:FkbM family methyltransferase
MVDIRMNYYRHLRRAIWNFFDGENTRRVQYPLTKGSVIVDAGGYVGEWSQLMLDRYGCSITIYEPQEKYARVCQERFRDDRRVKVRREALLDRVGRTSIGEGIGGASGAGEETCKTVDVATALPKKVDLLKLNIEGAEYPVLRRLIDSSRIRDINYLQIQFHDLIGEPDCAQQRRALIRSLRKTHRLQWRVPWVWESWERK